MIELSERRVDAPDFEDKQARKTCKTCKVAKPLTEFTRSRRMVDGWHFECKYCAGERLELIRAARKSPDMERRARAAWDAGHRSGYAMEKHAGIGHATALRLVKKFRQETVKQFGSHGVTVRPGWGVVTPMASATRQQPMPEPPAQVEEDAAPRPERVSTTALAASDERVTLADYFTLAEVPSVWIGPGHLCVMAYAVGEKSYYRLLSPHGDAPSFPVDHATAAYIMRLLTAQHGTSPEDFLGIMAYGS